MNNEKIKGIQEPTTFNDFLSKIENLHQLAKQFKETFHKYIKNVLFPDEYWNIIICKQKELGMFAGYIKIFQNFLNGYFIEDNFATHNERREFEHEVARYDQENGTSFHEFLDNQKMGRNKLSVVSIFEVVFDESNMFNVDENLINSIPKNLKEEMLSFDVGELHDESEVVKGKIEQLDKILRDFLIHMEKAGYIQITRSTYPDYNKS